MISFSKQRITIEYCLFDDNFYLLTFITVGVCSLCMNNNQQEYSQEKAVSYFGVFRYWRTYSNLLYLFLTFPLGIIFFTYAVTAFSVSVSLVFTFVGIILLYLFLWSLPRIMYSMGLLTEILVGVKMPTKAYKPHYEGSVIQRAVNSLKDKRILKTFFYFLLPAMPIGIALFTIFITLISTSLGLIALPFAYVIEFARGNYQEWIQYVFNYWAPEWVGIVLLILSPIVGFILLTLSLHLSNKLALLHGRFVRAILTK